MYVLDLLYAAVAWTVELGAPDGTSCIGKWIVGSYISLCWQQLLYVCFVMIQLKMLIPTLGSSKHCWCVCECTVILCMGATGRVRPDDSSVEVWLMKGDCRDDLPHAFLAEIAATATNFYFCMTAKLIPGVMRGEADSIWSYVLVHVVVQAVCPPR